MTLTGMLVAIIQILELILKNKCEPFIILCKNAFQVMVEQIKGKASEVPHADEDLPYARQEDQRSKEYSSKPRYKYMQDARSNKGKSLKMMFLIPWESLLELGRITLSMHMKLHSLCTIVRVLEMSHL